MSGYFLNTLVSAVVGALAAAGTTWYVSAHSGVTGNDAGNDAKVGRLEVDSIVLHDSLTLVDARTGAAVVEIKNGEVFVQNGVYADRVAAYNVTGQKLQTTPGDPLDRDCPVFGELAITEDGGGYVALLSPAESHSVTMGFDRSEKGCIISKNNDDAAVAAQAVFIRPSQQTRSSGVAPASSQERARARAKELRSADVRADSLDGSIRR